MQTVIIIHKSAYSMHRRLAVCVTSIIFCLEGVLSKRVRPLNYKKKICYCILGENLLKCIRVVRGNPVRLYGAQRKRTSAFK